MKKIFLVLLIFIISTLIYAQNKPDKSIWPLYKYKFAPAKTYGWRSNYFFYQGQNLYTYIKGEKGPKGRKGGVKKVYSYAGKPDVMRHFSYSDADAIVTFQKKNNLVDLIIFDKDYNPVYQESFIANLNIIDFDLQFDKNQKPAFMILSEENENYMLDIKFEGKRFNILTQTEPIITFGFNWENRSAHFLYQRKGELFWGTWLNGIYVHKRLPMEVDRKSTRLNSSH